jgi:hypothetical protein
MGGLSFHEALMRVAFAISPAFLHGRVIFGFPVTTSTRLLAAVVDFVHGCPRPALSLLLRYSLLLVTFFDMLRLPLLLIRVFRFVTAWHETLRLRHEYLVH